MKKVIRFFKRLWRLITGQEVRPYIVESQSKRLLGGGIDVDIDYTDIYDSIVNCETIGGLQKECSKHGITINTNVFEIQDKTIRLKAKHLQELIKASSGGIAQKYKSLVDHKIAELRVLRDKRLRELRLKGLPYDININYTKVYEVISKCSDAAGLQKECKDYGVTINTDIVRYSTDQTIQLICEELYGLLKEYSEGIIQKYNKAYEGKLKDLEALRERRIEELTAQGLLCPHCGGVQKRYYTGLAKIFFNGDAGGPLGGGSNVPCVESIEVQFHYKKCKECGEWKMYEYRHTPSWISDLFDTECPFRGGDIIEEYRQREDYVSHKIKRW